MKRTIEIDVPEGYDIEKEQLNYLHDIKDNLLIAADPPYLCIKLKKKEVKDWKWYINKYFSKEGLRNKYRIEDISNIPFELKIGLLKFICNDLGYNVFDVIYYNSLRNYRDQYKKVYDICPNGFIESLIKT